MKTLIKLFSSILFFLSATHFLFAQPTIEWQQNYGGSSADYAQSIQQTLDGGYIVAGGSSSNNGDVSGNNGGWDYWILKLDGTGNVQWEQNYGGSGYDYAYSIQQTLDGGYIVAGRSSSNDGDVSGNNGGWDYWILKLDGTGNVQWEQNYGGSLDDGAFSIQQTLDGGYIVAGGSESNDGDVSENNGDAADYWILKLDGTGNVQWEQNYGGSGNDRAYSIQQTLDGGYIVAGYSLSNDGDVSGNNGDYDYWIVKLSDDGNYNENALNSLAVKAYPVPTKDVLTFEITLKKASTDLLLQIFDKKGSLIQSIDKASLVVGKQIINFNVENLAAGIYTYQIITNNELTAGKFNVVR